MHWNELKTIAEGFKKVRPYLPEETDGPTVAYVTWEETVDSVADALVLVGKPLSNFLAACGVVNDDQG